MGCTGSLMELGPNTGLNKGDTLHRAVPAFGHMICSGSGPTFAENIKNPVSPPSKERNNGRFDIVVLVASPPPKPDVSTQKIGFAPQHTIV